MKINNLILSGGQFRGISYIGTIRAIEELNLLQDLENIIGVSSGAIFALMIALGFNSKNLESLMYSLSLEHIMNVDSDNIFNIMSTYGIDNGNNITRVFKIIIKKILKNENATFRDLYKKNPLFKLLILGTNLTEKCNEIFSIDTTPDMPLYIAMRITVSIPLYFEPVTYNGNEYIDGAFTNNFPINLFEENVKNTLGILLSEKSTYKFSRSLSDYTYKIIDCILSSTQYHFKKIYNQNTIELFIDYNPLDLKFDKITKEKLINEGYKQFQDKFKKTHFYDFYNKNKELNKINDNESTISDIMINLLHNELISDDFT